MATKTVYLFDPVSGEFSCIYEAQESPLEPGEFIEPISSTDVAPPTTAANQVAVFTTGAWEVESDFRGQIIYDQITSSSEEVTVIGAIPSGWALTAPPPTLASAQAAQIVALNAAYQAAIIAPVSFTNAAGTTGIFNQDATAKTNLENSLLASEKSGTWPLNLWLTAAGTPVTPFTYVDLQGLAAAMEAIDAPDYQLLLSLIAQVNAATTVAAVQAVVWG